MEAHVPRRTYIMKGQVPPNMRNILIADLQSLDCTFPSVNSEKKKEKKFSFGMFFYIEREDSSNRCIYLFVHTRHVTSSSQEATYRSFARFCSKLEVCLLPCEKCVHGTFDFCHHYSIMTD